MEKIKSNLKLLNKIMSIDFAADDHYGTVYMPLPNHNYVTKGRVQAMAAPTKTGQY